MKLTPALTLITAFTASALSALPILGYSSSTGFLLGGYITEYLHGDLPGSLISLDSYYGTAGVVKFQPSAVLVTPGGIIQAGLECRKMINKSFYGWGNNTDPDSSANMDFEMYNLQINWTLPVSRSLQLTAGVDGRFSTVFNREESPLWDQMPGQVFGETFTAGLTGAVTSILPLPLNGELLVETRGFFQEGDVSYAGVTGRGRIIVRPWNGGEVGVGTRVHRHFNVSETPLPYTSGIGANENLRGYSDNRFTGSVWSIAQFEVKQRVLELVDETGLPALTFSLAAFAEAGKTAESFSSLGRAKTHTDLGGGLRIGTGGAAEMRFDAGWGDQGMVISVGFDKAF